MSKIKLFQSDITGKQMCSKECTSELYNYYEVTVYVGKISDDEFSVKYLWACDKRDSKITYFNYPKQLIDDIAKALRVHYKLDYCLEEGKGKDFKIIQVKNISEEKAELNSILWDLKYGEMCVDEAIDKIEKLYN